MEGLNIQKNKIHLKVIFSINDSIVYILVEYFLLSVKHVDKKLNTYKFQKYTRRIFFDFFSSYQTLSHFYS